MSALLPHFQTPFNDRLRWELNPVLLKELRQAMRNSFLTGVLMFLLASLFLVWLAILGRQNFVIGDNSETGLRAVRAFLALLTAVSLFCVPLYTGIRLGIERLTPAGELMYATALPVWRIVRGKFLSAAYIQVLFFSIFRPFMSVAGLLRGVDLPTVFFILFCLYVIVCVAVQTALAVACIPVPLLGKLGLGLLFMAALAGGSWGIIAVFFLMLRAGIGTLMGSVGFWVLFIAFAFAATAAYLVCYGFSVAMLFDERRLRRHCRHFVEKGLLEPA